MDDASDKVLPEDLQWPWMGVEPVIGAFPDAKMAPVEEEKERDLIRRMVDPTLPFSDRLELYRETNRYSWEHFSHDSIKDMFRMIRRRLMVDPGIPYDTYANVLAMDYDRERRWGGSRFNPLDNPAWIFWLAEGGDLTINRLRTVVKVAHINQELELQEQRDLLVAYLDEYPAEKQMLEDNFSPLNEGETFWSLGISHVMMTLLSPGRTVAERAKALLALEYVRVRRQIGEADTTQDYSHPAWSTLADLTESIRY